MRDTYYIATGDLEKMFTLRCETTFLGNNDQMYTQDHHIAILGNTPETARENARKYLSDRTIAGLRFFSLEEIRRRNAEQMQQACLAEEASQHTALFFRFKEDLPLQREDEFDIN